MRPLSSGARGERGGIVGRRATGRTPSAERRQEGITSAASMPPKPGAVSGGAPRPMPPATGSHPWLGGGARPCGGLEGVGPDGGVSVSATFGGLSPPVERAASERGDRQTAAASPPRPATACALSSRTRVAVEVARVGGMAADKLPPCRPHKWATAGAEGRWRRGGGSGGGRREGREA